MNIVVAGSSWSEPLMSLSDRVYWLGIEGLRAVAGLVPVGSRGWVACLSGLLTLLERVWIACRWLNLLCM
jgi:hypothetical protein